MRLKCMKIFISIICIIFVMTLMAYWSGPTQVIIDRKNTVRVGTQGSDSLDGISSSYIPDLGAEGKFDTTSPGEHSEINSNKYLVYRCLIGDRCGGWADRLKGIVTGYILSTLTNRRFRIAMTIPDCDLLSVIQPNPNGPHWQQNISQTLLKDKQVSRHIYTDDYTFYNSVKTLNFSKLFKTPVVYFRANLDYVDGLRANTLHSEQLLWMKNLTRDQVYKRVFGKLFVLAPGTQKLLSDFLSSARPGRGSSLICAHIRIGRNPTLPKDVVFRATASDVQKVFQFLSAYNKSENHKIFMTSDSEEVMAESRKVLGTKMVENKGDIIHVDQLGGRRDQACLGFTKIILDQQIMINCDTLMISFSGFSRLAAYIRGKDTDTFCLLRNHTGVIPCKPSEMKELYHVLG